MSRAKSYFLRLVGTVGSTGIEPVTLESREAATQTYVPRRSHENTEMSSYKNASQTSWFCKVSLISFGKNQHCKTVMMRLQIFTDICKQLIIIDLITKCVLMKPDTPHKDNMDGA